MTDNETMNGYEEGRSTAIAEICSYLILDENPQYNPEDHVFYAKSLKNVEEREKPRLLDKDWKTVSDVLLDGFWEEVQA